MTTNPHNPSTSASFPGSAEETLRIVAGLPAPAGLEDRVRAAIHLARREDSQGRENGSGVDRRGRVLTWPRALKPQTGWMRTAAAAAIVFVVAGGGWGVYTRVEQNRPARILVMPPRVGAPGGFAGAGAVRTPQTLTRPTVSTSVQPAVVAPAQAPAPSTATSPSSAKQTKGAAPKIAGKNVTAEATAPQQ